MLEAISIDKSNCHLIEDLIDEEGLKSWLGDPFTFEAIAVFEDGKVIALGILRVIEEYKVILDPKLTNFKKAKAIKELMEDARHRSRCNETVVFVTRGGSHYIGLLKKHFGFQDKEGIALVKEH